MELATDDIRRDGGTQPRACMDQVVIAEYTEAMLAGSAFPPVTAFHDGAEYWLADGFHRVAAAEQAQIGVVNVDVRQGTRRDAVLFAVGANSAHGLRRTNEDKRRAVMVLLGDEEWARWSNREIGRRACVSRRFVDQVRDSLGTVPSERTYTTKHGTVSTMDTSNIGKARQKEQPEPEPEPDDDGDSWDERNDEACEKKGEQLGQPGEDRPRGGTPAALQSSASNEWYTPDHIVDAARQVLGGFDLDPASCELANEVVMAGSYYTIEDDGLSQPWHGRVWLNPPYGRDEGQSNQGRWSAKLLDEYGAGNVAEAILLVNAVTDRSWFHPFWGHAICFCYSRIRFYAPDVEKAAPTHGNVLVYLGSNVEAFRKHCQHLGAIVSPDMGVTV